MAKKKVWLTWLSSLGEDEGPAAIVSLLNRSGFDVSGDYWVNDLSKMAWLDLATTLIDSKTKYDLWVVAGNNPSFEEENTRYALSMIAGMINAQQENNVQINLLGLDQMPDQDSMPTLLQTSQCYNAHDSGWPSKLVSAAFKARKQAIQPDYRFNIIAHPVLGQWFEVGPENDEWNSVMLGVTSDSNITHHAVGERGHLPETSKLEYPLEGILAKIDEVEFTARSVQNSINPTLSYFAKIEGFPRSVIIGGYPEGDSAEVSRIDLI
jgi:hypothetical protein